MLTMVITQNRARLLLAQLEPAQFRMVELLAEGHTMGYIAERFGGCRETVIYRQLEQARRTCNVRSNADLVELHEAAQ